ncbi:MAG: histidine kinase [Cyanobacteria bacterium SBLK]|nr:histidine kinase [Cyanobacteria bacterium SBLK]
MDPQVNSPLAIESRPLSAETLHLLLFVDKRSGSSERNREIKDCLQRLKEESAKDNYPFVLEILEVKKRPDLVEYFRLVATPSLVKLNPQPRQILAGSDLVAQLQKWWQQWQREIGELRLESPEIISERASAETNPPSTNGNGYYPEKIRLSEEIFRLQKEKEELLEQLQFKDRVLAMLAHDLRSPLTAASIALETLELAQNQEDRERAADLTAQLYKQARTQFRTMNRMIGDILQAAKVKNGEFSPKLKSLDLSAFCEDYLKQFNSRLRGKGLYLKKDLPQDLPNVYADPELISQVLANLLDNAIKYTPRGGTIGFSILHRTTQKVQVSVCDTGPGIPEEKRDRIFEGHFRLERDAAKEGFGIGLALCRQVIQAHYGQIWVDSPGDRGSCFHFTLPVYQ